MGASPFDALAAHYDASFTHSACGAALRALVWQRFPTVFAGRERVLELGCGTGEDAIRLARAGHFVVATDASAEMIRVARLKAIGAGCADRIDFRVLPMESLHTLERGLRFDAVFSNFGAINCVADLERLAEHLGARLDAGAPLLFVVMGRLVPWEWLWYGLRAEPRKALRRLRRGGVEWRGSRIFYPSPGQLAARLRHTFTKVRARPLGLVLPPSYAADWLNRRPGVLRILTDVERGVQLIPGLARFGDHYLFEARRAA